MLDSMGIPHVNLRDNNWGHPYRNPSPSVVNIQCQVKDRLNPCHQRFSYTTTFTGVGLKALHGLRSWGQLDSATSISMSASKST